MSIEIMPLDAALGARVLGINLSKDISCDDFSTIHAAWLKYHVLIFPDQNLQDKDQVRFSRMFGELPSKSPHSRGSKSGDQLHQSVMLVSNIREDGKVIGSLPDGEMHFHTDGAYERDPYRYTMLYALEVPKEGGDTLFANMCLAFDTLPGDLKLRLSKAEAEQGFYTGVDVSAKMKRSLRVDGYKGSAVHPIFIRHEETERISVYVNRLLTRRIIGFDDEESQSVLSRLFEHSERSEIIYQHKWKPGDLVAWDNRCTNHARTDFSAGERRLLRRTTVQGRKPMAAF
ncbi:MAG: (S)-phenoxypropionate/alpha-ketoglutarate-dioxygenase [Alphaproteobacteria bacterium MarineAlpha11_Bin1]|nr:MAG: (S)-phenoxypropionate/alpha-ketoglutarate-dioxygenase [Alphaproteobacteria bacterium MarineAlpha11_Bin1]